MCQFTMHSLFALHPGRHVTKRFCGITQQQVFDAGVSGRTACPQREALVALLITIGWDPLESYLLTLSSTFFRTVVFQTRKEEDRLGRAVTRLYLWPDLPINTLLFD